MSLGFRRLFYFLAIIIFIIIAPAIVLYTAGYRYDIKKHQIQLTGSLYIKTIPIDTEIYLNEKLQNHKTPLKLNHLLPNLYQVKIKKEGYETWIKNLEILPGQVTFAENIILWPLEPTITTIESAPHLETFALKNDQTKLIWQNQSEVYQYNLLNNQLKKILDLPSETKLDFTWSQDYSKLLIKQNNNFWVINFTQPLQIIYLNEQINTIPNLVKFHPQNSDQIYYLVANKLNSYNILTHNINQIIPDEVQDFYWSGERWYYLTGSDKTILTYLDTTDSKTPPPLFQLPTSLNYQFIDIIKNQAVIYQPDDLTLYFFNLNPDQFNNSSQIIKPVKNWDINENRNKILMNNDWEVWVFNLDTQKSEIVTRVSQPITAAYWYRDNNYISVQYQDQIDIIELDRRDSRNKSTLRQGPQIIQSTTSQNGEKLYLLEQNQDKSRLNVLDIAEFTDLNF